MPTSIEDPRLHLQLNQPILSHSLSDVGRYLLACKDPIEFFNGLLPQSVFLNNLEQTELFREHRGYYSWKEKDYEEIRCFIGSLLWKNFVAMTKRRTYYSDSDI